MCVCRGCSYHKAFRSNNSQRSEEDEDDSGNLTGMKNQGEGEKLKMQTQLGAERINKLNKFIRKKIMHFMRKETKY